jgi:hypothetical protein
MMCAFYALWVLNRLSVESVSALTYGPAEYPPRLPRSGVPNKPVSLIDVPTTDLPLQAARAATTGRPQVAVLIRATELVVMRAISLKGVDHFFTCLLRVVLPALLNAR